MQPRCVGYAVPAYNFNNMEQLQAIVNGLRRDPSPVILQVQGRPQVRQPDAAALHGQGAVEMIREIQGLQHPGRLHLDHGDTFELCKSASTPASPPS
jgi:fructose-bisphosphate aldolase, class II